MGHSLKSAGSISAFDGVLKLQYCLIQVFLTICIGVYTVIH